MPDVFTSNQNPNQTPLPTGNPDDVSDLQNVAPLIPPPEKKLPSEHHFHALASFCINPVGISFQSQEPDEVILLFLRRHVVTNIPWIFVSFLFILLPIVLTYIAMVTGFDSFFSFLPYRFFVAFTVFYYLLVLTYVFIKFITWYFNVSLVTNKRVVDIDFSQVIYKDVSATKIDLIQDASFSETGAIRTFFDYGNVLAQTAASADKFDFAAVPHPELVVDIIESLIGRLSNV